MSTLAKLAGFVAILAVVFGVATVAGGAIDPDRGSTQVSADGAHGAGETDGDAHGANGDASDDAHGAADDASPASDEGGNGAGAGGTASEPGASAGDHGAHGTDAPADAVRGLSVADGGLRVVVETPELPLGRTARLAFRIVDADGRAVRDFELEHERRMHLIVARRDLTGFQHLHPRMAADGTWSVPIRIDAAGSHRLFADFSVDGETRTLASDLRVDGAAQLHDLPAPATELRSDSGDTVTFASAPRPLRAGRDATLRFTVQRDGRPVELERYLGAGGHLVALREGDLAFLHVHPTTPVPGASGVDGGAERDGGGAPRDAGAGDDAQDDGGAAPHDAGAGDDADRDGDADHTHAAGEEHDEAPAAGADTVAFATAFPTPGRYRLFLQYQVDGRVETVATTVEVAR